MTGTVGRVHANLALSASSVGGLSEAFFRLLLATLGARLEHHGAYALPTATAAPMPAGVLSSLVDLEPGEVHAFTK